MSASSNYFVCTLGEAALRDNDSRFLTVNDLVYRLAIDAGDQPAIGLFLPSPENVGADWDYRVLTFEQILKNVITTATILKDSLQIEMGRAVGLLSASSPQFLFIWLGCMWLGYPVLLIAPECSPSGVSSLCQQCGVARLIYDTKNDDLAARSTKLLKEHFQCNIEVHRIDDILPSKEVLDLHLSFNGRLIPSTFATPNDIAYLHHTSGTSSGTPKPIPQTHHGAVGALSTFKDSAGATFTTTPLYHGGPADTFRAWTSGAMIWLFPNANIPITAENVIKCLETAEEAARNDRIKPIKYFTSVPYILQIMAESIAGLNWLQRMDLVGVGGAALAKDVGDKLVHENINLVSRYGSAECGFLLSSHRDYEKDRDWQFLRMPLQHPHLKLEQHDNNLSELVVLPGWPHMAKTNREDGSYATSDLFEKHESVPNAWRYHSRADSQLTLLTGKKFDPAPVEDSLTASSDLIADSFMFGNDRPYPGVLVFRSLTARDSADQDFVEKIFPLIQTMNSQSQSHVKITRSMIVAMPYSESPLEKTSKGTLLRGRADARYKRVIDEAYGALDEDLSDGACSDKDAPRVIKDIITTVVSEDSGLEIDTDLFAFGVDSIAGMQIRQKLQKLVPKNSSRLPINVVEDCGNIRRLSEYIVKARHGEEIIEDLSKEELHKHMKALVDEYSHFCKPARAEQRAAKETNGSNHPQHIVLTGATGSLGAHALDQLRRMPTVRRIYCLVRGADIHAAQERVDKALRQRSLVGLEPDNEDQKVTVILARLGDQNLGLDEEVYHEIANNVTTILHLAWSVNFRMRLRSFAKDSIAGVQNLINLALHSRRSIAPKFIFCSSTASVLAHTESTIPEQVIENPSAATATGYSQSKWVAEQICANASRIDQLRGRIVILRVGQLSGDTVSGIWNAKEAWPLMLSSVKVTGTLPRLEIEVLDWLPVDYAARIVLESITIESTGNENISVLHVLNTRREPSWTTMLNWMKSLVKFEVKDGKTWIEDMDETAEQGVQHPAFQLLDLWRQSMTMSDRQISEKRKTFSIEKSTVAMPSLAEISEVDIAYFKKLWEWIDRNVGQGTERRLSTG